MTRRRLTTAAALAIALPIAAQADEPRAGDAAAIGQEVKSNFEQWQQYALRVQQCQSQLRQLHQQLVDAARPGWALYAKAQQTLHSLQQVQRIFRNGSLYLQRLSDPDYYRARVSSAQDQALAGDASQGQTQPMVHLPRHH